MNLAIATPEEEKEFDLIADLNLCRPRFVFKQLQHGWAVSVGEEDNTITGYGRTKDEALNDWRAHVNG